YRGVPGDWAHRVAHEPAIRLGHLRGVEKAGLPGPVDADEEPEAGFCGEVEHPSRRRRERADTVRAELANGGKVAGSLMAPGAVRAVRHADRAIGHAADEDLLTIAEEELAGYSWPSALRDLGGLGDGGRPRHHRQVRLRHGSTEGFRGHDHRESRIYQT